MDPKFLSPYNPAESEARMRTLWDTGAYANPDTLIERGIVAPDAPTFSIVLPPPNVTGTLHMGHAAMLAIEDTIVRFERMRGKRTLWLPGTDHAAIATQSKVEKIISKEDGLSRHDLGRDAFLARVHTFAQESHDTIAHQVRMMGASVDWSREAFTLDEARNLAVRTAFKAMYDDGLIFRKARVVNWDPKGQTTISDEEIVYEERTANLVTFRYWKDFPIPVATTRIETKVGDTAVAVHPDDPRYAQYIGQTFSGEFCGVPVSLRIIADTAVEKDFGTGALGVTPAHSQIDWEIAQRHGLPLQQVINEYGKMMVGDERILGKKAAEARTIMTEILRAQGLVEKEESVQQNVGTAERTGAIIEPLPKLQWWIDVTKPFAMKGDGIPGIPKGATTTLQTMMKTAVESKAITILPERFEKIYFQWVDNLRPWCISRQIWYGHRVPVWYRTSPDGSEEVFCGMDAPEGTDWIQDPDSLDTWFSSGLWTFSTMGWPDTNARDLLAYHPTNLLETGYDILPFWVARMILMTGYHLGTIPFKTVYLHGLVRDEKGRKMSKSLGNIVNPIDMIEKYGADATRMSLLIGAGPGSDMNLSEAKIGGYKKFANKLWNIARFVLAAQEGIDPAITPDLRPEDQAALDEFHTVGAETTGHLEAYRLHLAAEGLYHYAWNRLADVLLEERKAVLAGDDLAARASAAYTLRVILIDLLALLHPFMPFVTEEIWSGIPNRERPLIVTQWPSVR